MILFAAGWSLDVASKAALRNALTSYAASAFGFTAVDSFDSGSAFVGWSGTTGVGADVASSATGVAIVEGVCLDGATVVSAAAPPGISRDLDGQFAMVTATAEAMTVRTDDLGLTRLYWAPVGGGWIVANRVQLLARVLGSSLDLDGAAAFLSLGWASGQRTLATGVEVVPAGARWSWPSTAGSSRLPASPDYIGSLAQLRRRRPSTAALAETLTATCSAVTEWAGAFEAPLTAGLDSRLVFALLRAAGATTGQFVTEGSESNVDVIAGRALAAANGVEHVVYPPFTPAEIKTRWPDLARELVAQNDGMVSLWQVANLSRPVGSGALAFWGIGGEICRGYLTNPAELVPGGASRTRTRLLAMAGNADGLLTAAAQASVRQYLVEFEAWAREQGFHRHDVPDALYIVERFGRWSAANSRKAPKPLFAPLATKPFVHAAFSLPPAQRCSAPLHYRLLRLLAPDLHAFPVQKGGWPSQHAGVTIARAVAREALPGRRPRPRRAPVRGQDALIEIVHDEITAACLDRASSALWEIVDRGRCEQLLRGPAEQRAPAAASLLALTTLFEYEAFRSGEAVATK